MAEVHVAGRGIHMHMVILFMMIMMRVWMRMVVMMPMGVRVFMGMRMSALQAACRCGHSPVVQFRIR